MNTFQTIENIPSPEARALMHALLGFLQGEPVPPHGSGDHARISNALRAVTRRGDLREVQNMGLAALAMIWEQMAAGLAAEHALAQQKLNTAQGGNLQ